MHATGRVRPQAASSPRAGWLGHHVPGLNLLPASASTTTPATSPPGVAGSLGDASRPPYPSRSCSYCAGKVGGRRLASTAGQSTNASDHKAQLTALPCIIEKYLPCRPRDSLRWPCSPPAPALPGAWAARRWSPPPAPRKAQTVHTARASPQAQATHCPLPPPCRSALPLQQRRGGTPSAHRHRPLVHALSRTHSAEFVANSTWIHP